MKTEEWEEEIRAVSPLLAGWPRRMPHHLPEDYFEQNRRAQFPTAMPYELPAEYFDTLATQVVAKAKAEPDRPALGVVRGGRWKSWMAAAAATLVMVMGVQQFYKADRTGQLKTSAKVAAAQPGAEKAQPLEAEISEFLRQPLEVLPPNDRSGLGEALNQVSETELKQYLQSPENFQKPIKGI